jgi:protein-S-isoprenylcysteine O-methyltransferase Ste14
MLPQRYLIAIMLAVLWTVPFAFKYTIPRPQAVAKDLTARAGIVLQGIAKVVVWIVPESYVSTWRILAGMLLCLIGILTVQRALRHLDKQWRLDAALNADHQLIRTGPYALLRHPIYSAMFAMILGTGLMLARWPAVIAAAVLHIAGTEIRIRSEEKLLRSRFGEDYDTWAKHVRAYIPFIR